MIDVWLRENVAKCPVGGLCRRREGREEEGRREGDEERRESGREGGGKGEGAATVVYFSAQPHGQSMHFHVERKLFCVARRPKHCLL